MFQCAHLSMHTYTPHTSTSIHLQLLSHVCCLCKVVFLCSGNFITNRSLLAFCTYRHIHAHAHTHTHTHTHMRTHPHMHMHTHTGVMLQSQTCAYAHIKRALAVMHQTHARTHACTHTHKWPLHCKFVFEFPCCLLLLCAHLDVSLHYKNAHLCTQACMHKHTHSHKQTNKQTNKQTKNKHTLTQKKTRTYTHTLFFDTILLGTPPALTLVPLAL